LAFEHASQLGDLRQVDGLLFARGEVLFQRGERVFRRDRVRQDGDPMGDLRLLYGDGRGELLLLPHHLVRRHLAEIPREHRVAPAFLDLLRGGLRRGQRFGRERCSELWGHDVGGVELEVVDVRCGGGLGGRTELARRYVALLNLDVGGDVA
jgi:hypothetical protein